MTKRRTYTDDEIAAALARLRANRGNAKRTAAQLGVSRTTLRQWAGLSPVKGKQVGPQKVEAASHELAGRLDEISRTISERVLEAAGRVPIETSGDLKNMLIGQGITIEKASFARGGPTSRAEQVRVSLTDEAQSLKNQGLRVLRGGRAKTA